MKKCRMCSEFKDESQFNRNKSKPDGLGDKCRECMKAYRKQHYAANRHRLRQEIYAAKRDRKVYVIQQLLLYLMVHPCVDCGEADQRVLEFDHQSDKKYNVSELMDGSHSWETIKEEIDKCLVRCANCHRKKTYNTVGGYRGGWDIEGLLELGILA